MLFCRPPWHDLCLNSFRLTALTTAGTAHLFLVRLKELKGWRPEMEWADLLHVLWIGVARDLTGTLLMEVAEFHGSDPTYNGRLKALHSACQRWCTQHSIRPSTVEEWSSLLAMIVLSLPHITGQRHTGKQSIAQNSGLQRLPYVYFLVMYVTSQSKQ